MKKLKLTAGFLLAIVVTVILLSFFMPTSQQIEKSITINVAGTVVFEQLVKLENFNKWAAWNSEDSSVQHTLTGIDGTVGAVSSWKGDPEISGEGAIKIITTELNKKVIHEIIFLSPKKNKAQSTFVINEKDKNLTTVTWKFSMATPRPWNIFNLFFSMDKEKGKEFETGLIALKKIAEKK